MKQHVKNLAPAIVKVIDEIVKLYKFIYLDKISCETNTQLKINFSNLKKIY